MENLKTADILYSYIRLVSVSLRGTYVIRPFCMISIVVEIMISVHNVLVHCPTKWLAIPPIGLFSVIDGVMYPVLLELSKDLMPRFASQPASRGLDW